LSSAERARIGLAAAVLALVAGCAGQAEAGAPAAASSSSSSQAADDTTRRIAEVEFARQCTVASTSFVDEADITTDLDARLAAAGSTHQEWKDWHDALVDSPDLVEQFAEISAAGCPPA
jgi:hypothetical protein